MGTLNFDDPDDEEYLKLINKILGKRGLKPDLEEEWEIHGPHQDMNYQVYVGYANPSDPKQKCSNFTCNRIWSECEKHASWVIVAIYDYPDNSVVYEIEDTDDWWKLEDENIISEVKS